MKRLKGEELELPVHIYEVSLRDGLQNESQTVDTVTKLELLDRLVNSGLKDIEVGAFVSPRWVPQMADTGELFKQLRRVEGVRYWALVPNRQGLERALDVGVESVATFMSASETHNAKNLNRTMRESIAGLRRVIAMAVSENVIVRSYVSTVFGCPYEGHVDEESTLTLVKTLLDAGADTVALGDTTGMADPEQVKKVIGLLVDNGVPVGKLAVHLHDTRGTALANAYAAWQVGIRCFDGSVGGIGGCPYAPGATGNASTEDLVHLFQAMDVCEELDLDELCRAADMMEGVLGRPMPGRYLKVWQSGQMGQKTEQSA